MWIQALYYPTQNSGYFSLGCKTRTLEHVILKAPSTLTPMMLLGLHWLTLSPYGSRQLEMLPLDSPA